MSSLNFKIAAEPEEFEQIHRLNHETFAREIPQLQPDPTGRLVDKFHGENTYIVGVDGGELVAMIAVRDVRPFSVEGKLDEPIESYLPDHDTIVEFRKLAISRHRRSGKIIGGLFKALLALWIERGYDLAVVSATPLQMRLYRNLGFEPFASPVGTKQAPYQPMYLRLTTIIERKPWGLPVNH